MHPEWEGTNYARNVVLGLREQLAKLSLGFVGQTSGCGAMKGTPNWGIFVQYSPKHPSIQIISTLGLKVCGYYPHWAIWMFRIGLVGNLFLNRQPSDGP